MNILFRAYTLFFIFLFLLVTNGLNAQTDVNSAKAELAKNKMLELIEKKLAELELKNDFLNNSKVNKEALRIQIEEKTKIGWSENQLEPLRNDYKNAHSQLKSANKSYKNVKKEIEFLSKITYGKATDLVAYIEEVHPSTFDGFSSEVSQQRDVSNIKNRPEVQKYNKNLDTQFNPPVPKCSEIKTSTDEITGLQVYETQKEPFFSYTSDQLRPFFKGNNFLNVNGKLTERKDGIVLSMDITIASNTAIQEYGWLEKGSVMTLKFVNKNTLKLTCQRTARGVFDPDTKTTLYNVQYAVPLQVRKDLQTVALDKARLIWSTGYEDYPIFNVDFFMNQLNCLSEAKR